MGVSGLDRKLKKYLASSNLGWIPYHRNCTQVSLSTHSIIMLYMSTNMLSGGSTHHFSKHNAFKGEPYLKQLISLNSFQKIKHLITESDQIQTFIQAFYCLCFQQPFKRTSHPISRIKKRAFSPAFLLLCSSLSIVWCVPSWSWGFLITWSKTKGTIVRMNRSLSSLQLPRKLEPINWVL